MSGFLQRLVSRAQGDTPRVHSAHGLPFAPVPEMAAAAAPIDAAEGALGLALEPGPPGARPDSNTSQGRRIGREGSTGTDRMPPPEPSHRPGAAPASTRVGPGPVAPLEKPGPDGAIPPPAADRSSTERALPELAATALEERIVPSGDHGSEPQGPLDLAAIAQQLAPLLAVDATGPSWQQPQPPAADTHGLERNRNGQAVEETTEVHVHIGRIDVTAAPEPAAPRVAGAPQQRITTLEDYLAGRKGAGR